MILSKTPNGIYVNLENINYFLILQENMLNFKFKTPREGKFCVYGIFSTKPGYMNEGLVIQAGFNSKYDALSWLRQFQEKNYEQM